MKPTVVFRTDASTQIGAGHVKRCQSLGAALVRRGMEVVFVTRAGDVPLSGMFDGQPFTLIELPPVGRAAGAPAGATPAEPGPAHAHWLGTDWRTDAQATLAGLEGRRIAAVVVDHYGLDAQWHRAVSHALGCRMVAIDDLADRALAVDLIIDHNHAEDHRLKYRAVNPAGAPVLGGPRHALLAQGFENAPRNAAADPVRSVGIFMGGIDRLHQSAAALRGLRETAQFTGNVEIVTTSGNPNLNALREVATADGRAQLTVDAPDLASFFGRHELHIGAGGGATWERCCLGAPSIAVIVAENQRQVLLPLAKLDVLDLVEQEAPDAAQMGAHALALIQQPHQRKALSANAMQLVDGQGCRRIADHLSNLCHQ
jgi:UDP-2,4-diacetamido-2,4,6-trideoxy-beta-L-altropyranose hydrolase